MPWAHDGEVAMVKRRQLGLAQALDHSEDGGVDEADPKVRVGGEQIAHPAIILGEQILHNERSSIDLIEDQREPIAGKSPAEPIHLREHRRGHNSWLTCLREQTDTRIVIVVIRVQRGVENAGV